MPPFPITTSPRLLALTHTRFFTTSRSLTQKRMGANPQANQPDSINATVRDDTPNTDNQSSASSQEHKQGDDHPAKQPDPQTKPDRTTGIGGKGGVTGGKEGVESRG